MGTPHTRGTRTRTGTEGHPAPAGGDRGTSLAELPSPRTVGDVMTCTVVAVGRDADFKRIVRTMKDWNVSALPVLEGDGRVIGVVSEADLLPKEEWQAQEARRHQDFEDAEELHKAAGGSAADLMTTPAVTVRPETPLSEAARVMAERKIKRLPVTDAVGHLRGIISRSDVLSVFLRSDEEIAEEIRREVVHPLARTFGQVEVAVDDGVVTLSGDLRDPDVVPLMVRLVLSVEGVVNVHLAP
ncbi:CBS domain-containing protein [Streptomyces albus]|uniref:CBS domain-containing protein n=2 Tax=Streptomyces albus TaxID=1888 RepID=UPI0033DC572F